MLGIHDLWIFVIFSGLLLNIAPGPDISYIVGAACSMGWRGRRAAALGISGGCLSMFSLRDRPVGAVSGLVGGIHIGEMGWCWPISAMSCERCCFSLAPRATTEMPQ